LRIIATSLLEQVGDAALHGSRGKTDARVVEEVRQYVAHGLRDSARGSCPRRRSCRKHGEAQIRGGRVERRKKAAARVLGTTQDVGVGTQRGGGEQREDVAAARVSGTTKRRCRSEAVGVDAGARRGEKEDRDREVGEGCGAAWEQGGFWKVARVFLKQRFDLRILPSSFTIAALD